MPVYKCCNCGNDSHNLYHTFLYGIAAICSSCIINGRVLYKRSN